MRRRRMAPRPWEVDSGRRWTHPPVAVGRQVDRLPVQGGEGVRRCVLLAPRGVQDAALQRRRLQAAARRRVARRGAWEALGLQRRVRREGASPLVLATEEPGWCRAGDAVG